MIPAASPQESPERDLTDASLREEREKADLEMTESRAAVEKDADAVVEHAREPLTLFWSRPRKSRQECGCRGTDEIPIAIAVDRVVEDEACAMNGLRRIGACAASAKRRPVCLRGFCRSSATRPINIC